MCVFLITCTHVIILGCPGFFDRMSRFMAAPALELLGLGLKISQPNYLNPTLE